MAEYKEITLLNDTLQLSFCEADIASLGFSWRATIEQ
jgi:hypothetical protein